MEDIWQEFHRLPKAIRDAVARSEALATVDRLEQKYPGLDLASLIMRAMVKEFPVSQLAQKISDEAALDPATAQAVVNDLTDHVFVTVKDYLGLPASPPTSAVPPARPQLAVPSTPVKPPAVPRPIPPPAPPTPAERMSPPAPVQPLPPPPVPAPPRPMTSPVSPQPLTNVAPTQNYSDDDDREIAQQSRRVQNIAATAGTIDLDQMADQLMRQHNLAFRDELLQKRAVALFKARLKGIRDAEDTKAMLMRPPKVGGLGLDPDLSANVIASLEQAAAQLKSRGAVRPPVPLPPPPPPVIPKVQATRPTPIPPLTRGLPPENLPTAPMPTAPVMASRPQPPIKRPADIPAPAMMTPAPVRPAPRPVQRPSVQAAPLITRERQPERQMADITRPATTILGPAGEMSSMTLMEFRRLGQGAADSTRRLLEKFRHYQKESFSLWSDAVAGWRQSDVYRIYLDMGRQSLEQGIPISQVIQQRAQAGLPYLSEHEFGALVDFNRQLQV